VPKERSLPLYFVEVQFQRKKPFWANLFAKVFSYLEANDPNKDWLAVAIFPERAAEPTAQAPYRALLASPQVQRIYLDEVKASSGAAPGLKILELLQVSRAEAPERVSELVEQTRRDFDCERANVIVELIEGLLLRRFTDLNREEVRRMFKLHDLRESRVWQEGHEEGKKENQQQLVKRWLAEGKTQKEIAELLGVPLSEVRRLARR
jgi:predicted transposase/invertase (TIGR01784 family)